MVCLSTRRSRGSLPGMYTRFRLYTRYRRYTHYRCSVCYSECMRQASQTMQKHKQEASKASGCTCIALAMTASDLCLPCAPEPSPRMFSMMLQLTMQCPSACTHARERSRRQGQRNTRRKKIQVMDRTNADLQSLTISLFIRFCVRLSVREGSMDTMETVCIRSSA